MNKLRKIFAIIRNFMFSNVNKEFLIFLFFLFLSFVFWLSMTLNETYEKELKIAVRIVGIPKNVVLTSDNTDTIRITVSDKGMILLSYMYGESIKPINLNFKNLQTNKGVIQLNTTDLRQLAYQRMFSSTKITAIKPEKLTFYYNYGQSKRVPVRWTGRVIPEHLYFISNVHYWPDSVTVYASQEKLDSIKAVYTEQLNYVSFRDTLFINAHLSKSAGVKCVPDVVRIGFFTDVLTEVQIDNVPVKGINMPEGKILRTFPAKVSIRFVTGASQFRTLRPEDFIVYADYNEMAAHPSDKCKLYMKQVPHGISRAVLVTKEVDYLIEEE